MSYLTYSRLPPHIREFFKVYQYCTEVNYSVPNKTVRNYLQRHSPQHQTFVRHKLRNGQAKLSAHDFPYVYRQAIGSLFDSPYHDKLESLDTEELFKDEYNALKNKKLLHEPMGDERYPRISSTTRLTHKKYTAFHSNLIKSFASFYDPLKHLPDTTTHRNIYRWFNRLLQNTPITIVLKQRNRLFSDATVSQVNFPYNELKRQVEELTLQFDKGTTRTYHVTELVDQDILELAIKTQPDFFHIFDNPSDSINWSEYHSVSDPLSDRLKESKDIQVLKNESPFTDSTQNIFEQYPMPYLRKSLRHSSINDIFPYDIAYNDFFLLTIESPIIEQDHAQLLDLLVMFDGQFDIVGTRISTTHTALLESIESTANHDLQLRNGTYEDLLALAAKPKSHIDGLLRRLAEMGLTEVVSGPNNDCIYLLNRS